jgi:hypothetical protein
MAETKRKLASQVGLPRLPRIGPTADQKVLARWATDTLRTLEDQGVVLTGVQDNGTLMPIRSVIDFIGASVTDDLQNDRTQVSIGGGAGAAPVNAQYLVLALNGVLTAERVFVAGAGLSSTDGGANGNFTVNIGIVSGSHLVANADDIDWTGVTLRKNSGANVGTRRRINIIEGANISVTEADDAGGDEVDVTLAVSGTTIPSWRRLFLTMGA